MKTFLKVIKIIAISLAALLLLAGIFVVYAHYHGSFAAVKEANTALPFITEKGDVMISAHRSGAGVFPENTLRAFESCIGSDKISIDVFEFDLHITADEQLVLLHDASLDRTPDSESVFGVSGARPEQYTLEELKKLNFGAKFVADDGSMPYAELTGEDVPDDLRVTELGCLLDYLQSVKEFYYIIEIKNSGELGFKAADLLHAALEERGLLQNVIVGTFHGEVTEYMTANYPDMMRSASIAEVAGFWLDFLFGIKRPAGYYGYTALQIPTGMTWVVRLDSPGFINRAHEYGICTQYWTINDAETAQALIKANTDCIMSDYPDMLCEVAGK